MLCRRVDCIQDQRRGPGIDELMLRPRRNDDEVASFDVLVLACNGGLADARGEGQDLVDGMFLE